LKGIHRSPEDREQQEPQINAEGRRSRQKRIHHRDTENTEQRNRRVFDRINRMNKKIDFDPV
jgi:hypothetical protein